jgi:hypothetical protein
MEISGGIGMTIAARMAAKRTALNEARAKLQRAEGERTQIMKQLKDLGFDTVMEAETEARALEQQIADHDGIASEMLTKLEEEYEL